jgi:hypothetical protein
VSIEDRSIDGQSEQFRSWDKLIKSIRSFRSLGARFFKPVCVIAAIDLADEGLLDPFSLDADGIIQRFRRYVGVVYPERAEQGWRPLWHLSNDGLWDFTRAGRKVRPADFGGYRVPDMRAKLFDRFDKMTIAPRYLDPWIDPDARRSLRDAMLSILANDDETCRPFARQLIDPSLALTPDAWPPETENIARQQLDLFGEPTGVEQTDEENGFIREPFDPDSIDVVTRNMTVDLLLARAATNRLDLQPDFQRRWGLWDAARQSRLIESMLLRIPLPVIYVAENQDEGWEVVDGIQRLSTIARFVNPGVVGSAPLVLTGLEYLREFDGRTYGELGERLKTRLIETELQVHVIRRGTPPEVKFNVFKRINTGGVQLSPQEIRHAITPGPARRVLEDWAEEPEFLKATDYAIKTSRMDDRELVLRFLAFHLRGPENYRIADMDRFLLEAMAEINKLGDRMLEAVHGDFVRAMSAAHSIFGNDAFRKRVREREKRKPINKALFESVSVNLARLPQGRLSELVARRAEVKSRLVRLTGVREFESAISQGTADVAKVRRRFVEVERLLGEI